MPCFSLCSPSEASVLTCAPSKTYIYLVYMEDRAMQQITTVFKNGPSTQAIRIPREFRLRTKEVWIVRVHNGLLIQEKPESWDDFFAKTPTVTENFDMTRKQRKPSKRDSFK